MSTAPDPLFERLCAACDGARAACCKSGSVFLTLGEHAAIAAHCAATDEARAEAFRRLSSVLEGFAMLDQGEGCMFLDAADRCTLHELGLKPRECHWWPLHVYAESGEAGDGMAICLADYCCAGVASLDDARRMAVFYADEMRAALPALQQFRAVFPGTAPRRRVMDLEKER